jgi:uncharacterized oligopeptide transporter (OPT) family protein
MSTPKKSFQPFVAPESQMKELTVKSILVGSLFGVIFGASTVYLALKAGLTVSASIPIAVIAITLGRKFLKTTILENNIIQTTGSAGESIAAGVAFTLPGFLFLSSPSSAEYFNYLTILILAIVGGLLGTLLMIPLRKALIVNEHDTLPYPEGTACGDVLKAGEKGGDFARTAFWGLGVAFAYALLQKVLHVIAETPFYATRQINKFFPSAKVSGEITPEYLGVGYIIGPKIAGVLVAGSVLSWMVFIPLMSTLVPGEIIAQQLVKLGYLVDVAKAGGKGGWDPITKTFADYSSAIYYAFVRQIGAGAVAAGAVRLASPPTQPGTFQPSEVAAPSTPPRGPSASTTHPPHRNTHPPIHPPTSEEKSTSPRLQVGQLSMILTVYHLPLAPLSVPCTLMHLPQVPSNWR